MGVTAEEVMAIAALRRDGCRLGTLVALGRQEVFVPPKALRKVANRFQLGWSQTDCEALVATRYAEKLFTALGFQSVRSLDASGYENAELIHDMNQPLPEQFHGVADFVYDGGSSEHIFNAPEAFMNMNRLLRGDGRILLSTVANGYAGHGFYQFSPEFMYRTLELYGFADVRVFALARLSPVRWYEAIDPKKLGHRVEFTSYEQISLMVTARKIQSIADRRYAQQSDYADGRWVAGADGWSIEPSLGRRLFDLWRRRIRRPLQIVGRHAFGIGAPGLSRRAFRPFDPVKEKMI